MLIIVCVEVESSVEERSVLIIVCVQVESSVEERSVLIIVCSRKDHMNKSLILARFIAA